MDWKIELIAVPVTDIDRAVAFYVDKAGFALDHDHIVSDDVRFVQLTPARLGLLHLTGQGDHRRPGRLRPDTDRRARRPRRP